MELGFHLVSANSAYGFTDTQKAEMKLFEEHMGHPRTIEQDSDFRLLYWLQMTPRYRFLGVGFAIGTKYLHVCCTNI